MTATTTRRRRRKKPSPAPDTTPESITPDTEDSPETEDKEVVRLAGVVASYRERGFESRSPVAMARAFCIECMGGYIEEVGRCSRDMESHNPCPLYPLRMGKNTLSARAGRTNPHAFKPKGGDYDG